MTRFLRCGREAVLAETDDLRTALSLYEALRAAALPGVTELVPAARTVLIKLDPALTTPAEVRERAGRLRPAGAAPAPYSDPVLIPVTYDGPDLDDVAAQLGLTPAEVVTRHTGTTWTVAFTGFAPGFGYLTPDDPLPDVPRRGSPRTRIPAGSVGLAGRYSGVYPHPSPGGWQLIGTTTLCLWDLDRPVPALLTPGTRVRFVS